MISADVTDLIPSGQVAPIIEVECHASEPAPDVGDRLRLGDCRTPRGLLLSA
jgi:hypothetical protein